MPTFFSQQQSSLTSALGNLTQLTAMQIQTLVRRTTRLAAPSARQLLCSQHHPSRRFSSQASSSPHTTTRRATSRLPSIQRCLHTTPSQMACCGGGCGAPPPKTIRSAYIALGSNLGDRTAHIERACSLMTERGVRVKRTSSLWETEPMYVTDQARFLNGACEVETELKPMELLDCLQGIERDMDRVKVVDKGPRNIDLDILLYEGEVVQEERLKVPHIGIREREFVLRPLAELIPSQPLDERQPWRLIQDDLNNLPKGEPLSSFTPLALSQSTSPLALTPLAASKPTNVMAILNLTPDSFSDGGKNTTSNLTATISSIAQSGATIIDIGGQSTAPKRPEVSAEEELKRILPAIKQIRENPETKHMVISIDTYRASVAAEAIKAGADMINDVSAGQMDPEMLPTVAKLGATICLMHMRGTPQTMDSLTSYPSGLIPTVATELLARVAAAEQAGIRRWRIILDPGLGFAKTYSQNLTLLRDFHHLRQWPGLEGFGWLVGASRKRFIGTATGVDKADERTWGTAVAVAASVEGGADVVRVHDAKEMVKVVKMADALWRGGQDSVE